MARANSEWCMGSVLACTLTTKSRYFQREPTSFVSLSRRMTSSTVREMSDRSFRLTLTDFSISQGRKASAVDVPLSPPPPPPPPPAAAPWAFFTTRATSGTTTSVINDDDDDDDDDDGVSCALPAAAMAHACVRKASGCGSSLLLPSQRLTHSSAAAWNSPRDSFSRARACTRPTAQSRPSTWAIATAFGRATRSSSRPTDSVSSRRCTTSVSRPSPRARPSPSPEGEAKRLVLLSSKKSQIARLLARTPAARAASPASPPPPSLEAFTSSSKEVSGGCMLQYRFLAT
mmetsp:Transcript_5317/g.11315  ORF Transcript_5317/g.11315 Transcript_5317/m.11315 type:complete len:288 (-) Transcript_5317:103-966(-)